MTTTLALFLAFVVATLVITGWAASRTRGDAGYFAADRRIRAWQNGIAVAGDYMSAASFLGIAGIIAYSGFDGFLYSVGWLVAYLTVLLVVAEPLRNLGKYTMADVLAFRLRARPIRAIAALSTLTVSTFYMIAQMVGAGSLVSLLLKDTGITYEQAVVAVGTLMVFYVIFGGMLATTWVQIVKAVLLIAGTILLSLLVLAHFGWSLDAFFTAASHVTTTENGVAVTRDFLRPGLRFVAPWGPLDLISLGMALILGTAGLPHILVRFYTVPDARAARISVVWAMGIIGVFYILTTFLGFGAATIVGKDAIAANGGSNMAAPLLAKALGGELFFAFVAAIAFATILAVVAGLTISASTSFAHDVWINIVRAGKVPRSGEGVLVARLTALCIGAIAILIAIALGKNANVAFLVALAFAVAASANLPAILLTLCWRRFTTRGAICGLVAGLVASIALILIGPSVLGKEKALFPLENPGIVSIPIGFLAAWLGSLGKREPEAEQRFDALLWRAHTGSGAE